ncbi:MAG: 2-oxoacid:acceptor oxidoreductase family protein [Thermodesulfobacteriota bacterium]
MPQGAGYREIMITGFGGQGVIMAGNILGKAATIFDKKHATLVQSYGPEARGGACAAQLVISDDPIEYPYVEHPHVLICMSQEGLDKHIHRLAQGGSLFTDSGLVKVDLRLLPKGSSLYSIPATSLAEEMGVKMMANIIILGFAAAVTRLVSPDALRKAVLASVPKGTEEKNLSGLEAGFAHAAKPRGRGRTP